VRLTAKEIDIIKNTIRSYCDDATIYLFGSRLDESKKGGDIDLFIITQKRSYELKLSLKAKLKQLLHKPVDILLHSDFERLIEQEALQGVRL